MTCFISPLFPALSDPHLLFILLFRPHVLTLWGTEPSVALLLRSVSRQSRFSSKLSIKRQEAAAELAATEATLKIMEEMESERKTLEILEAENAEKQKALEQKRRELERLETVKRMNGARARLKV